MTYRHKETITESESLQNMKHFIDQVRYRGLLFHLDIMVQYKAGSRMQTFICLNRSVANIA
jgi:hypothetical protein